MVRGILIRTVMLGVWGAVAVVTAAVASPRIYLDRGALDLSGSDVFRREALRIAGATFADGAGPYLDPSDHGLVSPTSGDPPGKWRPRTLFFKASEVSPPFGTPGPLNVGEDALFVTFGCYTAAWPCLGLQVVELAFPEPVYGLAGWMEYYFGFDVYYDAEDPAIPLLGEPYRNRARTASGDSEPFYRGFFAMVFDAPVTSVRFAWREGTTLDDVSWLHLTDVSLLMAGWMHPVPEPASVALLAAALLGLGAAARCRPVAAPALPRRARSPT